MAQQAPSHGYMVCGPPPPMMAQQYMVTIQNTGGHLSGGTMKVKAIKVTGQIQLFCGLASIVLGIVAIQLMCNGYLTGTPIWGGLACYFVAGVLGLFGARRKSRCIIIAYMVLSIISSVIAVQQVFMSTTLAVFSSQYMEFCPLLTAVGASIGLLEIVASIVAAAYCCKIVCCGQSSTTMVQYVPAMPVGDPQPGMLQQGLSVYSPVTCPATQGDATRVGMPAHPPPYNAEGGPLPTKQCLSGPYHSNTGAEAPAANESLLS